MGSRLEFRVGYTLIFGYPTHPCPKVDYTSSYVWILLEVAPETCSTCFLFRIQNIWSATICMYLTTFMHNNVIAKSASKKKIIWRHSNFFSKMMIFATSINCTFMQIIEHHILEVFSFVSLAGEMQASFFGFDGFSVFSAIFYNIGLKIWKKVELWEVVLFASKDKINVCFLKSFQMERSLRSEFPPHKMSILSYEVIEFIFAITVQKF